MIKSVNSSAYSEGNILMSNINQLKYATQLNQMIDQLSGKLTNLGRSEFAAPSQFQSANVFFTTSVLGMKAISHVIEDKVFEATSNVRLFSSFQKLSRVKPQQNRYRRILKANVPVYMFGLPDAPLWQDANLHQVALSESATHETTSLVNFWFVVLHDPDFVSMALVSRELQSGWPTRLSDKVIYRNFEGFWTYDNQVINQVVALLEGYIKAS